MLISGKLAQKHLGACQSLASPYATLTPEVSSRRFSDGEWKSGGHISMQLAHFLLKFALSMAVWYAWLSGLALCWAQGQLLLRAALEGKGDGEVSIIFRQGAYEVRFPARLSEGKAIITWPAGWQGPAEIILSAFGYLPLRYGQKVSPGKHTTLDFTDPRAIHAESGYALKDGKVYLAAGDLGQLPDEAHPIINAYDIELFYIAQKNQDLKADFNGDGRVDEADFALLLKNQNLLLRTVL